MKPIRLGIARRNAWRTIDAQFCECGHMNTAHTFVTTTRRLTTGCAEGCLCTRFRPVRFIVGLKNPGPRCAECGEARPSEFRDSEPRRCKACRRAYNAKRHKELKSAEGGHP